MFDANWKQTLFRGKPLPRTGKTPCWKCPKSVNEEPNPGAELTDRGRQALAVYSQIKAGRPMPNDTVVWWYCGLFRWTEDTVERNRSSVAALMASLAVKGNSDGRSSNHRPR